MTKGREWAEKEFARSWGSSGVPSL